MYRHFVISHLEIEIKKKKKERINIVDDIK